MELRLPLENRSVLQTLRVGDIVYLSGVVATMRDLGHRRALSTGSTPVDLRNWGIMHAGPVVRREGDSWRIVSIGPTTSRRMDAYVYELVKRFGVAVIVGKGGMGPNARRACRELGAVYLELVGGTASLITKSIKRVVEVHWLDLGVPEAMWILEIEKMGPCIVAIDTHGNDIHESVEKGARERMGTIIDEVLRDLDLVEK